MARAGNTSCKISRAMPPASNDAAGAAGLAARVRPADDAAPGQTLAHVFAALGDPTRLKLVGVLCGGGAFSIAHLTQSTDISRQGVTKHLNVLAEAGVVRDIKIGRERLWQLEPGSIDEARR